MGGDISTIRHGRRDLDSCLTSLPCVRGTHRTINGASWDPHCDHRDRSVSTNLGSDVASSSTFDTQLDGKDYKLPRGGAASAGGTPGSYKLARECRAGPSWLIFPSKNIGERALAHVDH